MVTKSNAKSPQDLQTFNALVEVLPLDEIADPQGSAIERSLPALGFDRADQVRVGKAIRLRIRDVSQEAAEDYVAKMCERLLVNPVIEQVRIQVTLAHKAARGPLA